MNRRDFIASAAATTALPLTANAQQSARMRRMGIMTPFAESDQEARSWIAVFRRALEDLGWREGRNIAIEYWWGAGQTERFRSMAAELVSQKPDVILVAGATSLRALQQETQAIPIVFVVVSDPVGGRFVDSLSRPGRNITGFSSYEASIGGKWLETLKEISPSMTRAAVLLHPETNAHLAYLRTAETAGSALGVAVTAAGVHGSTDIDRGITQFASSPNGGLIVLPHPITDVHRERITTLAAQHRLPAIYPYRFFVQSGGLVFYGIDVADLWRRAGSYVDRTLRGAKPADLPVQLPTKFQLVVNLKSAKALGLSIPEAFLLRANEVIE